MNLVLKFAYSNILNDTPLIIIYQVSLYINKYKIIV